MLRLTAAGEGAGSGSSPSARTRVAPLAGS